MIGDEFEAFRGRKWIRRFDGGSIAELSFDQDQGQVAVTWTNPPFPNQKSKLRRLIAEYVPWKHSVLQEFVDETGKPIIDLVNTASGVWKEYIITPRKKVTK